MTEPVYRFIRGQGWVVGQPVESVESAEATVDGWHILLEARDPGPGERFYAAHPFDKIESYLKYVTARPDQDSGGLFEDYMPSPVERYPGSKFITITKTKL